MSCVLKGLVKIEAKAVMDWCNDLTSFGGGAACVEIKLQAPFNFWCVAVGVGCCSLYAVEGIPRRSCPSLGLSEDRGAEIARRDRSHSARSEERLHEDGVEGSTTLSDAVDAKID